MSLSLDHQRKSKQTNKNQKLSSNPTLEESYTKYWTNLRRTETKRKKEFNIEAWEQEISNRISLKKNEKAEKYYTNEGTS